MGVKQGIQIAGGVVPEGGGDRLLVSGADHATRLRILHPGLGHIPLDPGQGAPDGPVVGLDDADVAADQGNEGDGLGG